MHATPWPWPPAPASSMSDGRQGRCGGDVKGGSGAALWSSSGGSSNGNDSGGSSAAQDVLAAEVCAQLLPHLGLLATTVLYR